jgi:hypothetical protein
MVKKGVIEEIFSKALFADEPKEYRISYRDFRRIKETSLPEFLVQSNNFQTIPISRVKCIKKSNTILFEKN